MLDLSSSSTAYRPTHPHLHQRTSPCLAQIVFFHLHSLLLCVFSFGTNRIVDRKWSQGWQHLCKSRLVTQPAQASFSRRGHLTSRQFFNQCSKKKPECTKDMLYNGNWTNSSEGFKLIHLRKLLSKDKTRTAFHYFENSAIFLCVAMVSSCRPQFFWRALVTCAHVIQRCRYRGGRHTVRHVYKGSFNYIEVIFPKVGFNFLHKNNSVCTRN